MCIFSCCQLHFVFIFFPDRSNLFPGQFLQFEEPHLPSAKVSPKHTWGVTTSGSKYLVLFIETSDSEGLRNPPKVSDKVSSRILLGHFRICSSSSSVKGRVRIWNWNNLGGMLASSCSLPTLLILTEFPSTHLPKKWQLGTAVQSLLASSSCFLARPALGYVCSGVTWFINKQDQKGKNPLLWRIRSVAELGKRGNQALFSHPSVHPACLKQSGQRSFMLLGADTWGWGLGGVGQCLYTRLCVHACERESGLCSSHSRLPPLSVCLSGLL